jgi:hypothetical protein
VSATAETWGTGVHLDIPEPEYHALPGLSSTGIKKMLDAPAVFEQYQREGEKPRTVFDVGSAAHAKILGVGAGVIAYPDEHLTPSGNVSTKKAVTEWAAEQRTAGLIPVAPDQIAAVDAMAEAVLDHTDARILLTHGQPEVSIIWDDPETGARCRGRIDYVRDNGLLVDLKTADGARPWNWAYKAEDHGYFEQRVHYGNGWEVLTGSAARFLTVVVDKKQPHLVFVAEYDEPTCDKAAENVQHAIDAYAKGIASGDWPRLPDGIHRITATRRYLNNEHEEF